MNSSKLKFISLASYISFVFFLNNLKYLNKIPLLIKLSVIIMACVYSISSLINYNSYMAIIYNIIQFILITIFLISGSSKPDEDISLIILGIYIHTIIAIIFILIFKRDLHILIHPTMTSTSLGILLALAAFINLSKKNLFGLIISLFLMGLMYWTGSRTGALILISYILFFIFYSEFISNRFLRITLIIMLMLGVGIASIGVSLFDGSGRDQIWVTAINALPDNPWFGIGAYSIGSHLADISSKCELWPSIRDIGINCSDSFVTISNSWLIAHNSFIQWVADSGTIGFSVQAILFAAALSNFLAKKDITRAALLVGLLTGSTVDATTSLPSPGFGEVYWLLLGQGVGLTPHIHIKRNLLIKNTMIYCFLLSILFIPSLIGVLRQNKSEYFYFHAPDIADPRENYRVMIRVLDEKTEYKANLQYCEEKFKCVNAKTSTEIIRGVIVIDTIAPPIGTIKAKLAIYPVIASIWQWIPIASYEWELKYIK